MTATVSKCEVMNGVLAVNKEAGWTSHDVVAKLRQLLGGAKVGHAGHLGSCRNRPAASVDRARALALRSIWLNGTRSTTPSCAWERPQIRWMPPAPFLSRHSTQHLTEAAILEAVGRFRGAIEQVPPMYSAVKIDGVPLYRSARAGKTIARDARTVVIHELDVLDVAGQDVALRVVCSKGTYIRSLCADIGKALGVGAHLRTLERTRVGPLRLNRALTVDAIIRDHHLGALADHVWSLDDVLRDLPAVVVDAEQRTVCAMERR